MNKKNVALTLSIGLNLLQAAAANLLVKEHDKTKDMLKKTQDMAVYFMRMLDDRDVELNEFDIIALRELGLLKETEES